MGIASILIELTGGDNPLLTRNEKTNKYRVTDPRHLMCIRVALSIDPDTQSVTKGDFVI